MTNKEKAKMKQVFLAALVCRLVLMACEAKTHEWPQLPERTLPDTEVATNVALRVDTSRLDTFSLRLEVASSVSNEVVVAVGHDSDEDGDLSFGEAAFAFGCDCGVRYIVDYHGGRSFDVADDTLSIDWRDFDPEWNLAKVVKRGEGAIGEGVVATIENKKFSISIR